MGIEWSYAIYTLYKGKFFYSARTKNAKRSCQDYVPEIASTRTPIDSWVCTYSFMVVMMNGSK